MVVYFHNINKPYVCIFDIEHDNGRLLQFAGILFKRVGSGLYQVCSNTNFYVKQNNISPFIKDFLNIDEEFMEEYGIDPSEVVEHFKMFTNHADDILFVSHGINQDAHVLKENGIDIMGEEHCCTYNLAKRVLQRSSHLTVEDISNECGCTVTHKHNAYSDAVATICIFSYLTKRKGELK